MLAFSSSVVFTVIVGGIDVVPLPTVVLFVVVAAGPATRPISMFAFRENVDVADNFRGDFCIPSSIWPD